MSKYFVFIVMGGALELGCLLLPAARAQVSTQSVAPRSAAIPQPKPTLKTRPKLDDESASARPSTVPVKAIELYRKAVHELHQGQASAAAKDAQRAVSIDEKFADADALAATAGLMERNYTLARAEAIQAAQVDPRDEKAWVIAATADNYLGWYAEAVGALSHIPEQGRSTWQVAYQWARAAAGQGNVQQALEWSNRAALTASVNFAPLHLLRASSLLAENQYSLSAAELETYLSLIAPDAPQHSELEEELARLRRLATSSAPASVEAASAAGYNALAN